MTIEKMYHGDLAEWMDYNAAECDDFIPGCLLDNMVITAKDGTKVFCLERVATEWTSYYEMHIYGPHEQTGPEIEAEWEQWSSLKAEVYTEIYGEAEEA